MRGRMWQRSIFCASAPAGSFLPYQGAGPVDVLAYPDPKGIVVGLTHPRIVIRSAIATASGRYRSEGEGVPVAAGKRDGPQNEPASLLSGAGFIRDVRIGRLAGSALLHQQ